MLTGQLQPEPGLRVGVFQVGGVLPPRLPHHAVERGLPVDDAAGHAADGGGQALTVPRWRAAQADQRRQQRRQDRTLHAPPLSVLARACLLAASPPAFTSGCVQIMYIMAHTGNNPSEYSQRLPAILRAERMAERMMNE